MKKATCSNHVFFCIPNIFKLVFPAFFFVLLSFSKATAQTITVSTTTDENNGTTTNIASLIATPGGAGISLREATIAANNEAVGSTITINIPAGTYTLTITGNNENGSLTGDLDINATAAAGTKTINLTGAGPASTTINTAGGWNDRILDLEHTSAPGDITVTISGITFTGGNAVAGTTSGGAILAGFANNVTSINNCVFTGNIAPSSGGAISQSSAGTLHTLTITNSTFNNNTATAAVGGAVSYNGLGGTVTITGCTFSGNTCGTQGGAVNISGTAPGPLTTNITGNNFVNNTANGTQFGGGAIGFTNAQTININFNRLSGNTSPNLNTGLTPNFGNGRVIIAGGGATGTFNVDNNWWGLNTGPVTTANAQSIYGTSTTRWLQLKNTASPSAICTGATSIITAGFLSNNLSEAITAGNLTAFVGQPITFNAAANGTLSSAQTTIQASGTATVTFTATTAGSGTANAVFVPLVENVTVTSTPAITITAGPSITSNPSASTACSGLAASFTGAASGQTSLAWQESTDAGFTSPITLTNTGIYSNTSTTTLNISDNSGVSGRYYRLVAINSNGCPNANSTGALLTATIPVLSGNNTVTQAVNTSNNNYYAASCAAISKVVPSGASPISGNVTSQVWVEGSVPTVGGTPFVQRHYQVTPSAGSTATVTLYFSQTEFDNFNSHPGSTLNLPTGTADNTGKANLRIGKYTGSSNNSSGLPSSYTNGAVILDPPDGNIVWNATASRWEVTFDVSGFSGFIVQTALVVLPLKLESFTARLNSNRSATLQWSVTEQQGIHEYVIEKAINGSSFSPVGSVNPVIAASASYSFNDLVVSAGKNYYRLKIIEQAGKISYSDIVFVTLKNNVTVLIYPNPVTDHLTVQQFGAITNTKALLLDGQGRVLQIILLTNLQQRVKMQGYSAGVYTLKFEDGSVFKIIKQL